MIDPRRWNRSLALASAAVAALAATSMASAQTSAASGGAAPGATAQPEDATTGGLDDIVVTAQKRSQSLQDVPISVSVVTGALLDQAHITTTTSIGQLAPSVSFTSGFGIVASSFNIRGIGSYVSEIGVQPAVSVVVDGVPLARNAEFVGELGELDRIEVLNGPQGTLFGRNSTGGAINVVRKLPTDTADAMVETRLNAGKEGGTELMTKFGVGGPLAPGVRARVSGYMLDRSDYVTNVAPSGRGQGKENSWGLVGKLAVDLGESVDLLLTGEGRRYRARVGENHPLVALSPVQQPNIPDVTARHTALLGGTLGDLFSIAQDDATESALDSTGVTADFTGRLSDDLTIRSITSYRDVKVGTQPDVDGTPAAPGQTFGWDTVSIPTNNLTKSRPRRRVQWDYLTQEVRLEYSGSRFDLIGGVFYQDFEEKLNNAVPLLLSANSQGRGAEVDTPTGPASSFPYYFNDAIITPRDRNRTLAGFADVTFHASDALDVFAGYRLSNEKIDYDYRRVSYFFPVRVGVNYDPNSFTPLVPGTTVAFSGKRSDSAWAGRVGARYQIASRVGVYATASRGYIGNGVDLSRATGGTAANPGLAFLEASVARNFEVGFKSELLDRRVRLNGAVFDLLVKDLQAQALIPGTVNNRVQNAGDIRTRGVELTLDALVTDSLRVNGGFSYIDSAFRNFRNACYPGQTAAQGCVSGAQSIDGKPGLNAPEIKFNIGADLRQPLGSNGTEIYLNPRYNYQSKVFYTLDHDPLATQRGYGTIDLTLGLAAPDAKFDVSVFARNLTNKHFCLFKSASISARVFCSGTTYDAQRIIGVAGRARF